MHLLSREPKGSHWQGERGRISKALVQKYCPKPGPDVRVFVCGPDPLFTTLCGPRGDLVVTDDLAELGYKREIAVEF